LSVVVPWPERRFPSQRLPRIKPPESAAACVRPRAWFTATVLPLVQYPQKETKCVAEDILRFPESQWAKSREKFLADLVKILAQEASRPSLTPLFQRDPAPQPTAGRNGRTR